MAYIEIFRCKNQYNTFYRYLVNVNSIDDIVFDQNTLKTAYHNIYQSYFYNSAFLIYNGAAYYIILGKTSLTGMWEFSDNGVDWHTSGDLDPYNTKSGDVYTRTINQTNGAYNTGYRSWGGNVTFISSTVKTFQSITDYNEYVTKEFSIYTWSSVPSISGKDGIPVLLTTLNDINDGEAITTSDTTKFNRSANANVGNVISEIINT